MSRPSNAEVGAIAIEQGLQIYLREINETPLLTAEQERALSLRIRDQSDPVARDEMIRSNLRLVVNIAKIYSRRGLPLADLIEEGNLGLMHAVERFDPDQGSRFTTYASWWIKQTIKRALASGAQTIHIPAYMVEMIAKWRHATSVLEDSLGRPPVLAEVAQHMKLPERKVEVIRRAVKAFSSASQGAGGDDEISLSEIVPDEKTLPPEDMIVDEAVEDRVRKLLDQVDERESEILRYRFGLDGREPLTLKQIGKQVGLTRERVRQLERLALKKLNAILEDE